MKKINKKYLILVVVMIALASLFITINHNNKVKSTNKIEINKEKTKKVKEIKINDSSSEDVNVSSDNIEPDNVNEQNNESSVNNVINDTYQNNEVKQSVEIKQEVKQEQAWDKLGISEYDYYNKPALSWQKVDFSISTYGSQSATEQACKDYGDKYVSEHDGGYWCYNIRSYSGSYLGEQFSYFE